jgi:hypothetical protein
MVCELEVIFGLDAVAGQLGVARHALVLFEQLGGIAALPVVLAITAATTTRHSLRTLSTATATAAALTIIDQAVVPYRTRASLGRRKTFQHRRSFPRDRPPALKALAAPLSSAVRQILVHRPMASGVAAEALCDCLKRPRAWGKM